MAKVRVVMHSAVTTTASSTRNAGFGMGDMRVDSSDETIRSIPWRTGGTASLLDVSLDANASSGTSTLTLHNQTTATDLTATVSIGAGATGRFSDLTDTDPITAGNRYDFKIVTGAVGGLTFGIIALTFEAASGISVMKLVNGYDLFHSASGFFHWSGTILNTANDAGTKSTTGVAGTWKNLDINVGVNPRTTTTVYNSRVNGANGNMTVSVGSGATGLFSDLVNSDVLGVNDQVNWATTMNAGDTGVIVTSFVASEFHANISGASGYPVITSNDTGVTQNFNVTTFYPVAGSPAANGTESTQQTVWRAANAVVSQYGVSVTANTIATSSTAFRLRVNGANSVISIGVGAGVTGQLRNLVGQVTLVSGDLVDHSVATPNTSGSIVFRDIHFAVAPPVGGVVMAEQAGMVNFASFSKTGSHQAMGLAMVG